MNCNYCGNYVEPGTKFCPSCGAPQPVQAPPQPQPQVTYTTNNYYQQPYQQPQQGYQPPYQAPNPYAPQNLSYTDFYNRYASKKTRNYVTWMAVICFFTAVLSVAFVALGSSLSVLDIVVYAAMGGLLLASKQSVFALLPTIYGAIWTVVSIANEGSPTGFVAIVVGIACVSQLSKVQKAYNKYKLDGLAPTEEL